MSRTRTGTAMNIRPIEQDRALRDQTIAERLDEIERVLKFDPHVPYRRELIREYLAYTTDPEERYERA